MKDLIERQAAIDVLSLGKEILSRVLDETDVVGVDREKYSWGLGLIESYIKDIEELSSAQPLGCSDILDELKDDDYYNYIHTGHSRFSEDDWDYLIYNAKEKEELHERLDKQAGGD